MSGLEGCFPPRDGSDEELIDLAIDHLVMQGQIEEEDEALYASLRLVLEHHRGCIVAIGDVYQRDAQQLAHCWMTEGMWSWQRQAPRFECPCGIVYAIENSGYNGWAFFSLEEDGRYADRTEECECGRQLLDVHKRRREVAATGAATLFE